MPHEKYRRVARVRTSRPSWREDHQLAECSEEPSATSSLGPPMSRIAPSIRVRHNDPLDQREAGVTEYASGPERQIGHLPAQEHLAQQNRNAARAREHRAEIMRQV